MADRPQPTDRVLVAILNEPADFARARDEHWYRIPVESARKWVGPRWPPHWLAFYQTKIFRHEAHQVRWYAEVLGTRQATRAELFPNEVENAKRSRRYYQILLGALEPLPQPILSRRLRRITFIPTTWAKLSAASEINDLWDGSPLEDRLWAEMKRWQIRAERQEFVEVKGQRYAPDFTIYCAKGRLAVETDGDTWHANPEKAADDNLRDNALESSGWRVLRFTTSQVREQAAEYCLPTVVDTVNDLGGLDEGGLLPRRLDPERPEIARQLGLFDRSADEKSTF